MDELDLALRAKAFRLPPVCACGAAVKDRSFDGFTMTATYACGSKFLGWKGLAGPVCIRNCAAKPARVADEKSPAG